jgi:hypothetical protein
MRKMSEFQQYLQTLFHRHKTKALQQHTALWKQNASFSRPFHLKKGEVFFWMVVCGFVGEGRGVHRVLVGKPEEKRPMVRPRRRWENNIKMDLQEVGRGCGDWVELAQDRDRWRALVSAVMNFLVP